MPPHAIEYLWFVKFYCFGVSLFTKKKKKARDDFLLHIQTEYFLWINLPLPLELCNMFCTDRFLSFSAFFFFFFLIRMVGCWIFSATKARPLFSLHYLISSGILFLENLKEQDYFKQKNVIATGKHETFLNWIAPLHSISVHFNFIVKENL